MEGNQGQATIEDIASFHSLAREAKATGSVELSSVRESFVGPAKAELDPVERDLESLEQDLQNRASAMPRPYPSQKTPAVSQEALDRARERPKRASGKGERVEDEILPEIPLSENMPLPIPQGVEAYTLFKDIVNELAQCFGKASGTRHKFERWALSDANVEATTDLFWWFMADEFLPHHQQAQALKRFILNRFCQHFLDFCEPIYYPWPPDSFVIALQHIMATAVFRMFATAYSKSPKVNDALRRRICHQILAWCSGVKYHAAPGKTTIDISEFPWNEWELRTSPCFSERLRLHGLGKPKAGPRMRMRERGLSKADAPEDSYFDDDMFQDSYKSFAASASHATRKALETYDATAKEAVRHSKRERAKADTKVANLEAHNRKLRDSRGFHKKADELANTYHESKDQHVTARLQSATANRANARKSTPQ